MDFVQPEGIDDIYAEMGVERAAPVAIPEEVKPKPAPVMEAPKEKQAVITEVLAPAAQEAQPQILSQKSQSQVAASAEKKQSASPSPVK